MCTDTRVGRVAFPANDRYLHEALAECGDYCLEEMQTYSAIVPSGATVLDIGANIGLMSLLFSKLVGEAGKVHAFEPSVFTNGLLAYNVSLNGCRNVVRHRKAVSDSIGETDFVDPEASLIDVLNFGSISLDTRVRKNYGRMVPTPVVTIDSLGLDRCDFIKIDVEGYEAAVVRGGEKTIGKYLPFISLETGNPADDLTWLPCLLDLGYRVFVSMFHLFSASNFKNRDISHLDSVVCPNAIAVPPGYDHKQVLGNLYRAEVDSLERLQAICGRMKVHPV